MPAGDHEVSRCIHDEVIYSDVLPQDPSTKGDKCFVCMFYFFPTWYVVYLDKKQKW